MLKRIFFLLLFVVTQAIGAVFAPDEIQQLKQNFFANIKYNGAIVASPSQKDPDYYYDWTRDSAIAMGLVASWYESTHASGYKELLIRYVSWTQLVQHQSDPLPGQDILGEPKFYIDGQPYTAPWGRPQNDGPALRASVLIRFANELLNQNEEEYVRTNLYNNTLDFNSMGVIKADLEYTAHHWAEENFDLWEEIFGHHFFTAMVQQKALLDGAKLARRLNDGDAAAYYESQAYFMSSRLQRHLDKNKHLIQSTLAPHSGPQKTLEMDSSIILAVLQNQQTRYFTADSDYVKNTVKTLHQQFNDTFPINNKNGGAILFGRYPGDTYDGYQTNGVGNPWFILTATMAEYYYTLAAQLNEGSRSLKQHYISMGDDYLKLIKKYAPDMQLSEQINLNTGIQQGAHSLTWSYVSVLRAIDTREHLVHND